MNREVENVRGRGSSWHAMTFSSQYRNRLLIEYFNRDWKFRRSFFSFSRNLDRFMRRFLAQTLQKSGALSARKSRWTALRQTRYNSSTTTPGNAGESANSAKRVKVIIKEQSWYQPSILVTHGEPIFRLILVSQATFGILTVFWWHMHYFETQDEQNGLH